MDIKDFGKQLDGISFNNSFDNAIFFPDDVANILPKFIYWNNEMEALWIQNPYEEDVVKKLSASFFVTIKTNEKGLFINNNLVVEWDNKRIVKDNAVMYQSHGAALVLTETNILCKFGNDEIDSIIEFNVDSKIKDFVENNQSTYIILGICNHSFWKKEEICVVRSTKSETPKYKGKIMADESGLYLDGELRYGWSDYFPLIRKQGNKKQINLLKRTELANWGNCRCGFYPQENYFVMTDATIMDKEDTILIGHACKLLCDYDSLFEKKDLPVLKNSYSSLEIKDDVVLSPIVQIEHERNSQNAFFLLFNLKWIKGTGIICLDFHDDFLENVNDDFEIIFSSRFKEGVFTIVLDEKIDYTLKLASSTSGKENHNKCDFYAYSIGKHILRKMGLAQRLDIKLKGNGCEYTVKANELIDLAKTFDEELFDSPIHEIDYYKADLLFEKKEYLDANRYILTAIEKEQNNEMYKELAEKIRTGLIDVESKNYTKAQKLFDDKKFEESVKLLDSIHIIEKEEAIKSLRKNVIDSWFTDLAQKGDENMSKKNTLFAINDYRQALKLYPDNADLKSKLQNAEILLSNKTKKIGEKILLIIAVIVVLLIGVVIYGKLIEYKEEQEHTAIIERVETEEEKAIGSIKTRLNDICKDISACKDTRKYLSVRLKGYVDKALKIEEEKELYGEYLDADMWTNTQDSETITADILDYTIGDEENISVKVLFKDSYFGDLVTKILAFRFENNNWYVNDIFSADYSKSLFVYTDYFIKSNDEKRSLN